MYSLQVFMSSIFFFITTIKPVNSFLSIKFNSNHTPLDSVLLTIIKQFNIIWYSTIRNLIIIFNRFANRSAH